MVALRSRFVMELVTGKKFLSETKRMSLEIAEKTAKKFPIKISVGQAGLQGISKPSAKKFPIKI